MILHLLPDEKFTDYAIAQFSAPEMESEFVLIPYNQMMEQVKLKDRCRIVDYQSPEFKDLVASLGNYTGIILHGMFCPNWQEYLIKNVPSSVKLAWMFWGGEIYGRPENKDIKYAPITRLALKVRSLLNPSKSKVKLQFVPYGLYQRIDFCLTGELEEYEYAKAFLNHPTMQHIWYTYYDMNATLGSLKSERCNGNNVIVGNSATVECNYFDVIPKLRRHLDKDQKVVLPLSYGSPWIMNAVRKYAKFWLGKHAWVLSDFMEREQYNRILQSCSTMIMAQYNPQAQGNILTGLWLGMRVYLSEKSIAYKFFKRLGFVVFSFESEFKKYHYTPLTDDEFEQNRKVLTEWYSAESVMKAVQNVVNELSESKKDK